VSVAEADFRDVDAVLATVDTSAPVCLIFGCILHFFPAGEAASLLARYTAALAQGSYLVMSVIGPVDEQGEQGQRMYTGAGIPHYTHSDEEIAAFCAGLDLVPPGIADARSWGQKAAGLPAAAPHAGGAVLVTVARRR
jgi:O-methyltransferase involved in polyketide biosynthesis